MEDQNETRRLIRRLVQAEQRITSLEASANQTAKKTTSGVAIIGFVILALVVYHYGWVAPIGRALNSLVVTFNKNVERYNDSLYR